LRQQSLYQGADLLTATATAPRENLDPVHSFVALERYNAIRFIQAVDGDFQQLTKSSCLKFQHIR
jgi:hypothetical protein